MHWFETLESRRLLSAAPLVQVSANGRYLVANNNPFYIVGDSVWVLPTAITETQAGQYMQQRAAQGFNTILMDAALQTNFGGPTDTSGDPPFDADLPGTSNYDVTTPDAAYWSHIDHLVSLASQNGLEVVMNVWDNYSPYLAANSTANLTAYGQFLGQRYANDRNIIWMLGNDYSETPQIDTDMAAVIQGIRDYDPTHLMTLEGWYDNAAPQTSFSNTALRSSMSIDGIYYYPGFYSAGPYRTEYLAEYDRSDFGPLLNLETQYETGPATGGNDGATATPAQIRQQDYDFLLNGATGDLYGDITVWKFDSGWQQQLASPGATQMQYFVQLEQSIPWQNLVPDQNGTVFQNVGTPPDYSGAYTPDGSLALAYQPSTGSGSLNFTVNMAHFNGPVTAQWFDPTNGSYTTIATNLANSGTHTFTSPANNSAGQNDFVLVLKTATAAGTPVLSIDSGGGASGSLLADTSYTGGVTSSKSVRVNRSRVSNAPALGVFTTQRYGNFTYNVGRLQPHAAYTIRLDFAELYMTHAGQRLFDVSINGDQILTNFDIFAAAGGRNNAIAQTFTAYADKRGRLTIAFTSVKNNACVSAIEIATAG